MLVRFFLPPPPSPPLPPPPTPFPQWLAQQGESLAQAAAPWTVEFHGPITCMRAYGRWIFAACYAPMPPNAPRPTAVPIGLLHAIDMTRPAEGKYYPPEDFIAHKDEITAMDVYTPASDAPAEPILFTGSKDGSIKMWRWDGSTFQCLRLAQSHMRGVTSLCTLTLPGGACRIYSGSDDKTVNIYNPSNPQRPLTNCIYPPAAVAAVAPGVGRFAHAAAVAASHAAAAGPGDQDHVVVGVSYTELETHGAMGETVSQTLLLVGYRNGLIRVFSLANPDAPVEEVRPGHRCDPEAGRRLTAMAVMEFEVENPVLLTGYSDGAIVVRDISNGIALPGLVLDRNIGGKGHTSEVSHIVRVDDDRFVSGSADGRVITWRFTLSEDQAAVGWGGMMMAAAPMGGHMMAAPMGGYGGGGSPYGAGAYGAGGGGGGPAYEY
jgi:hypothetical protein